MITNQTDWREKDRKGGDRPIAKKGYDEKGRKKEKKKRQPKRFRRGGKVA